MRCIKKLKTPIQSKTIFIIYLKRIPEILEKYLSIDAEYRLTLRNTEGKNAEELMLES